MKNLFYRYLSMVGLLILGFAIGAGAFSDGSQSPKYITVTEPQVHTVIEYKPFEVARAFCPQEDSCVMVWRDRDGNGEGSAELVEVEH